MNHWIRGLVGGSLWLLAACAPAQAQERRFEKYNCAFTPPAGWEEPVPLPALPHLACFYQRPDGKVLVALLIEDSETQVYGISERSAAEFEKGMTKGEGSAPIWGRLSTMGGLKCYERLARMTPSGQEAFHWTRMTVAGRWYTLRAMSLDGDASEDRDLHLAFESFRFLQPPTPPLSRMAALLEPDPSDASIPHRVGVAIGYYIMIGGAVFLLVVLGIVLMLLVHKLRGRGPRPPSFPLRK